MRISILIFIVLVNLGGQLQAEWAEKILKNLTLQEKIGQLFIVPACPRYETESLFEVIETYHVGSILMKQALPLQQIPLINALQNHAKLPLLCAGDAEWGLGMRMEETLSFPKNLTLGAIQDEILLYECGKMIGQQCKLVGIHLNFAPVVDVNSNPNNPIIGMRAFGDDPENVSTKSALMIRGMQDSGILACAKHFPGHGDVDVDSHHALPFIPHSLSHLEKMEFIPFKCALAEGVEAVMSGHLFLPALDNENPASLSYSIMTELLKETWGFHGLLITDALNMKALSENYTIEEIAVGALMAGHDLLLYGAHLYNDVEEILKEIIPLAFAAIEKGVVEGKISEEVLDAHVLKILSVKERLGLHQNRLCPMPKDLMKQLYSEAALTLHETLYREAVTVLNNTLLPAKEPGYVKLWEDRPFPKVETLVVAVNHADQISRLREICEAYPQVIVALFASPYLLKNIPEVTTVVGYEWCEASEKAVWDVIIGKEKGKGELPVVAPQ